MYTNVLNLWYVVVCEGVEISIKQTTSRNTPLVYDIVFSPVIRVDRAKSSSTSATFILYV